MLLTGLTPEEWEVRAHADGFAAQTTELKLQGTQQAELSFALAAGGRIHGTVKDEKGRPLAGLWVFVRHEAGDGGPAEGLNSDAEGRFHFDFVPLGEALNVGQARHEGYLAAQQIVTVTSEGDRDVEVNLVLKRRPKGGSVEGLVTDQEGKPIGGAEVTNGWRNSREKRETFTDTAGRFVIDDVFTGGNGTFVVVRAKGFAPQAVEFTPGPEDNPAEVTVKLVPGHTVRGRVLNLADQPIAGVRVSYDESQGRGGIDDVGGEGTTDGSGRFEFDSLPADCSFDFWAQGYSRIVGTRLALDDIQEALVRLQPPGIIRGRVVNAATGEPLATFRVRLDFSPDRQPDDPRGFLEAGRAFRKGQASNPPTGNSSSTS